MDRTMATRTQNKTPTHTLIRVRNNQRRHRERRRQYIAFLEQQVHHGECLLNEARAKITELEAASRYWRCQATAKNPRDVHDLLATRQSMAPAEAHERLREVGEEGPKTSHPAPATITDSESRLSQEMVMMMNSTTVDGSLTRTSTTIMSPAPRGHPTRPLFTTLGSVHLVHSHSQDAFGPSHSQRDTPTAEGCTQSSSANKDDAIPSETETETEPQGPLASVASCNTYPGRQGESTVPCRLASLLIAQQNVRGTDDDTVRSWLEKGFRDGNSDQDQDCRVETVSLFALLDFISTADQLVG
ncbi:hypothetical protein G647_02209 [Cladophialophora carrionii CBS 160.54]|uniref:BZIP domain-containing protein n=1 Tax=Cladophialophora carrionii CBS 160.54 TaxID=1279043 RepID=V9DFK8_9EURO|nr:uncharacterized protein G647_02209 [Cladophialophora carrionii CBS 160.54]ETI25436.1 hypothetical protein G647_02209 [Cladophialophora carrionii CBS 160.54]